MKYNILFWAFLLLLKLTAKDKATRITKLIVCALFESSTYLIYFAAKSPNPIKE